MGLQVQALCFQSFLAPKCLICGYLDPWRLPSTAGPRIRGMLWSKPSRDSQRRGRVRTPASCSIPEVSWLVMKGFVSRLNVGILAQDTPSPPRNGSCVPLIARLPPYYPPPQGSPLITALCGLAGYTGTKGTHEQN